MCVGLSARVLNIEDDVALVDANGARRRVSARVLSGLEPGDYVMVHAGIAIAKITEDENAQSDALFSRLREETNP